VGKGARRPQRPTIIDVAARVGVSPITVSRVVNGRPGVGPETRVTVLRAIREMGYTLNLAARSLVTADELRIGVIYSNPSAAFMSDFLTGVFEEASIRGARLILLKGEGGQPPAPAKLREFLALGISGVILTPPLGEAPEVLRILRDAALPMAAVGAYAVEDAICVRIDDRSAAYQMTRNLIDLGHRRIGFVAGNPDQVASAERLAGFEQAAGEQAEVETRVARGDFSFASGLRAGEMLLDDPTPPSAIFASNDDMAAGVVSVAHRRQIDVPGQLTVVGFDDTPAATNLWPPLTTVHQPVHKLAAEALGLLVARIGETAEASGQPENRVLKHEIVRRQSTSPPAHTRRGKDQLVSRAS
jgi:LacI family transcriptional regulator